MNKQEYTETRTVVSPDGKTRTTVTVSHSCSADTVTTKTSVMTTSTVTVQHGETVIPAGKDAENGITE